MSDPSFLPGQTLTASDLQLLGEYGSWTPTLTVVSGTAPTLGSGATTDGVYHRNGRLITVTLDITFGASGTAAGSGTYLITNLPFPIDPLGAGMAAAGWIFGLDGVTRYPLAPRVQSSAGFTMCQAHIASATEVNNSSPATWGANDAFRGTVVYIGAP